MENRMVYRHGIIFLIMAVLLEVFVFNWNHWGTLGYQAIDLPLEYCPVQGQDEDYEGEGILFNDPDGNNVIQFSITGSGVLAENICFDVTCVDGDNDWWGYLRTKYAHIESPAVRVRVLLSNNKKDILLKDKILSGRGKDIVSFPAGSKPEVITVLLSGEKGKQVLLSKMSINADVPFKFDPLRAAILFLIMSFIYVMHYSSELWKRELFDEKGKTAKAGRITAVVIFMSVVILNIVLIHNNQIYIQSEGDFKPYTDLARALAKGQLYLDMDPSEELLSLADPYDPIAREEITAPFQLDYAYYEGKYYIYFGVIPCLVMYLPFYMITGADLPGWVALCILLALIYGGMWLVIREMMVRYAKRASDALGVCLWLGAASALSLPAVTGDASNYYVPMLAAVAFFLYGMYFCLKAAGAEEGKKRVSMTAAGSLCMACIAGCRPQLVLGAACILPVMLPLLFEKKDGKLRLKAGNCIAFVVPFIIIAAGLMLYNALRFGSPFDFGAMYNLTFAFLSQAGFSIVAGAAGIFYYLFRPLTFCGNYPYLDRSSLEWSNPNMLASHPSCGGLFMLYPVLLFGAAVIIPAKEKRMKELKYIGIIALVMLPVIAALTAMMGGLMDRYRMDVAVFGALAFICGILMLNEWIKEKDKKIVITGRIVLSILVSLSVIVSGLTYAVEGLNSLLMVNPEAYITIANAIEFWR